MLLRQRAQAGNGKTGASEVGDELANPLINPKTDWFFYFFRLLYSWHNRCLLYTSDVYKRQGQPCVGDPADVAPCHTGEAVSPCLLYTSRCV